MTFMCSPKQDRTWTISCVSSASFNDRAVDPTCWRLHVYSGPDYLEKLAAQRPGEVVIVAGRNNEKMRSIHFLHEQGFHVLGDKPWLIESGQIGLLKEVTASAPLAMDIMTERHEIANRVQRALMQQPAVFGDFRIDGDQPAIAIRSVHHLYKMVNNRPLQRPAWYFDPAVQGEGIADVTTHLVDLVQWMTGNGVRFDFDWHVERLVGAAVADRHSARCLSRGSPASKIFRQHCMSAWSTARCNTFATPRCPIDCAAFR